MLFLVILHFGITKIFELDIDLHGKYYHDIEIILDKHFYKNEPPFKIITGNSFKMREKVIKYLSKNDHKFMSGDLYNQGYIQVL